MSCGLKSASFGAAAKSVSSRSASEVHTKPPPRPPPWLAPPPLLPPPLLPPLPLLLPPPSPPLQCPLRLRSSFASAHTTLANARTPMRGTSGLASSASRSTSSGAAASVAEHTGRPLPPSWRRVLPPPPCAASRSPGRVLGPDPSRDATRPAEPP
eukprot:366120-Chlamydomonas_euryale.AAC.3